MPNALETTRRDSHTGTSTRNVVQQIGDLFDFPGLYDLGPIAGQALRQPGSRGRRSHYPPTALLAVAAAARAARSLPQAVSLLGTEGLWSRAQARYKAFTDGEVLPDSPPSRDAVFYFMERLADNEDVRQELREQLTRSSVAMARHLGTLEPGYAPDWAAPDERHTIYGDGTYLTPYSDVQQIADPISGETVFLGSRATVRCPRVADARTTSHLDGKSGLRGINHIAISTWTRDGRVVLAVGQAAGAESVAALRLIESVAELAADGVHTLIYDRAITGWLTEYLLSHYRIQTIGKSVGRASSASIDDAIRPVYGVDDAEQTVAMKRLAVEHSIEYTRQIAPLLRPRVIRQILENGAPQPVGTSIYARKNKESEDRPEKGPEVVRSKYYWLPAVEHPTAAGSCRHNLVVDDGALFTVTPDPEHGWAMKTGRAECISSVPHRVANGWHVTNTWRVPCENEAFEHTTRWSPNTRRGPSAHNEDSHTHLPTAMRELRPISRSDGDRFDDAHGRRNDSESYNNWFKNRLDHKGRAASLRPGRQDIDFLVGAILNNSNTWYRNQHPTDS